MSNSKRQAKRVIRELTPAEKKRLDAARMDADAKKDQILAQARVAKAAWAATQHEVRQVVASLRAKRQSLGLSLADVENRTGIRSSVLSRLENDPNCNPTVLTLQRLATAMDLTFHCTVMEG